MAPKPKWTPEQQEFINVWMPEFLLKKGKKGLDIFWPKMKTAFFNEWPEELVLDLPLQQVNADPNAERPRLLNAEEKKRLEDALEARTGMTNKRVKLTQCLQQLKNSFFNAYAKIRTQSGGVGKSALSLAATLFKARPKARRRHQVLEIYQKLYKVKVRAALMNSGYERENEAAQGRDNEGEWIDDDDDEVKMNRTAMARSNRMKIWRRVVQDLWDAEPEEVQENVREEAKKEVLPVKTDEEGDDGERTPEEYEMSIKESMQVAEMFLAEFQRMTGWMGVLVYGGPIPRLKGKLGVKAVSFGLAPGGLGFDRWHPAWEKGVTNPLFKFLRQAIPRDVRLRRSIFTGEETDDENDSETDTPVKKKKVVHPDSSESATQGTSSKKKAKAYDSAPAAIPKPPRRPKKPKKKVQATLPAPMPPAAPAEPTFLDKTRDGDFPGMGSVEPTLSATESVRDVLVSQESQDDFLSEAGGDSDFLQSFLSQQALDDFSAQIFTSQRGGNDFIPQNAFMGGENAFASQHGQHEGAQVWGGWDQRYSFSPPEGAHLSDRGMALTAPQRRRLQISARAQLTFAFPGAPAFALVFTLVFALAFPGAPAFAVVFALVFTGVSALIFPGAPAFNSSHTHTPCATPQVVVWYCRIRTHTTLSCAADPEAQFDHPQVLVPSHASTSATPSLPTSGDNTRPIGFVTPPYAPFPGEANLVRGASRGANEWASVPTIKATGERSKAGEAVARRSRREDGGGEGCEEGAEEGAGKEEGKGEGSAARGQGVGRDARAERAEGGDDQGGRAGGGDGGDARAERAEGGDDQGGRAGGGDGGDDGERTSDAAMKAAEEEEKKSAVARKAENMRLFNPDGPSQLYITRTKRTVHAPSNRGPVLSLKERGEALDAKSRAEDDLLLKALNGNGKKRKGATEENRVPAKNPYGTVKSDERGEWDVAHAAPRPRQGWDPRRDGGNGGNEGGGTKDGAREQGGVRGQRGDQMRGWDAPHAAPRSRQGWDPRRGGGNGGNGGEVEGAARGTKRCTGTERGPNEKARCPQCCTARAPRLGPAEGRRERRERRRRYKGRWEGTKQEGVMSPMMPRARAKAGTRGAVAGTAGTGAAVQRDGVREPGGVRGQRSDQMRGWDAPHAAPRSRQGWDPRRGGGDGGNGDRGQRDGVREAGGVRGRGEDQTRGCDVPDVAPRSHKGWGPRRGGGNGGNGGEVKRAVCGNQAAYGDNGGTKREVPMSPMLPREPAKAGTRGGRRERRERQRRYKGRCAGTRRRNGTAEGPDERVGYPSCSPTYAPRPGPTEGRRERRERRGGKKGGVREPGGVPGQRRDQTRGWDAPHAAPHTRQGRDPQKGGGNGGNGARGQARGPRKPGRVRTQTDIERKVGDAPE
ncbi:hypothetical protein C8R44DRAFT_846932 [Mycena epipterygia]|nr:hypothetical protein C8R44DRAFT_846932 [Mycena epipterygia]